MIEASVVTKIQFKDEDEFKRYISSDVQANITGFSRELLTAWETKKPYIFKAPHPGHGNIVTSEITVIEKKKCSKCYGAKFLGGARRTCFHCNGSGKEPIIIVDPIPDVSVAVRRVEEGIKK